MRKFLFLNSAQRFSDFALLLLRVFVGLFLIWSVWDNITDGARMQEYASFLAKHEFPVPEILAPRLGVPSARHRVGLRVGPVHALGRHSVRDHFCRGHCHGRSLRRHARRLPVGLPVRHRPVPGHVWRRALLGGFGTAGQRPAAVERRRAFQELIAMARNIEIKARIESVALLTPKVAELASEGPIEIAQDDTFFNCVTGRLKLRAFSNDAGELIFYRRVNQTGPKESFYLRSPTSSPETLRESLIAGLRTSRSCPQIPHSLPGRTYPRSPGPRRRPGPFSRARSHAGGRRIPGSGNSRSE